MCITSLKFDLHDVQRGNVNVVVSGGNFTINEPKTAITPLQFILQTFGDRYVQNATHDNNDLLDTPKCHPGTRTSFLYRLSTWVKDNESPIYVTWLHGPAGAGKSAIARSLADSLQANSLLAGSFFFFRTDLSRNTEKPLITTLAYQIACNIPETQPYIANAISVEPSICTRSLQTQFKTLILEPLKRVTALGSNSLLQPMLIVIDGLDECVDRTARNLILKTLFDTVPRLHGRIKFLVVSRPEYDIQRSFNSAVAIRLRNTIELEGDLQAYEDVRNYLRDNFHRIKHSHPLSEHFPPNWPSEDAIERLVEKSSGHFIYASTVIKYIENDFHQPQERLDIILNLRTTSQSPYAALDALYLDILTSSVADHSLLLSILSILVLNEPFPDNVLRLDPGIMKSVGFIETILSLQAGGVQLAFLDLKSLVGVKKKTIQFWHKSFSDFLLDSSRSNEFYANPANACTAIAKGCLRLLSDETDLLESSWLNVTNGIPTLDCHHLLSLCCRQANVDPDLQSAMMKYEFNVIPPSADSSSWYFWVLCSCLDSYQHIFEGTRVVEYLQNQFDKYLLAELRRWVPLDSEIMDALKITVLPHRIDWTTYKELACKNPSEMRNYKSCFLLYMSCDGSAKGEVVLCQFFYSKDRAHEYYLGELPSGASISSPIRHSINSNAVSTLSPKSKREGQEDQTRRRKRQRTSTSNSPELG